MPLEIVRELDEFFGGRVVPEITDEDREFQEVHFEALVKNIWEDLDINETNNPCEDAYLKKWFESSRKLVNFFKSHSRFLMNSSQDSAFKWEDWDSTPSFKAHSITLSDSRLVRLVEVTDNGDHSMDISIRGNNHEVTSIASTINENPESLSFVDKITYRVDLTGDFIGQMNKNYFLSDPIHIRPFTKKSVNNDLSSFACDPNTRRKAKELASI